MVKKRKVHKQINGISKAPATPAKHLEKPASTHAQASPSNSPITAAELAQAFAPDSSNIPKNQLKSSHSSKPRRVAYITAVVFSIIATISFAALLTSIFIFNILPTKYLTIITLALVALTALNFLLAFFKKNWLSTKIISIIFSIAFSAVAIFGFLKIMDSIGFFSNFGVSETTSTYNLLVAEESAITNTENLSGEDIYIYRDLTLDSNLVSEVVASDYDAQAIFVDNLLDLITGALGDTSRIIAINSGTYDAFLEDNNTYKDRLRIIGSFDITVATEETTKIDITNTPFAVYISGIDTRTGTMPSRSLSDVNIVAVVNPVTHKILLVSTPRDYYVHLAGTSEYDLPDKLTHAGSIGGIELSKATMSELLGINIEYYFRVNFNFVSNLVDSIGGINVYSDVDYSFRGYNYPQCIFNPGYNYVYGECALAFTRERYAYSNGDRHRGENQEQVINLIFDKITQSSTLLSSYSDILSALSGTFETNLSMEDITSFIRYQLEDMPSWTIESQNLDGVTGGAPTYSYPYQDLSVMYPDEASILAARIKIAEVLGIDSPIIPEDSQTEEVEIEELDY